MAELTQTWKENILRSYTHNYQNPPRLTEQPGGFFGMEKEGGDASWNLGGCDCAELLVADALLAVYEHHGGGGASGRQDGHHPLTTIVQGQERPRQRV